MGRGWGRSFFLLKESDIVSTFTRHLLTFETQKGERVEIPKWWPVNHLLQIISLSISYLHWRKPYLFNLDQMALEKESLVAKCEASSGPRQVENMRGRFGIKITLHKSWLCCLQVNRLTSLNISFCANNVPPTPNTSVNRKIRWMHFSSKVGFFFFSRGRHHILSFIIIRNGWPSEFMSIHCGLNVQTEKKQEVALACKCYQAFKELGQPWIDENVSK